MAGVRDPAFWRRFSVAVHLNDDAHAEKAMRPELKHSDSWLERQNSKKTRRTFLCWIFWVAFCAIAAGVVIIVVWLNATGHFNILKNDPAQEENNNNGKL